MKLQSRDLALRMRGDDVALLQRELRQLRFTIDRAELTTKRFGTTTRDAVQRFQREHDLEVTGVVDEATARQINAVIDALGGTPTTRAFAVHGTILNPDGTPVPRATIKAFDTGLRSETPLGEATTEPTGSTKSSTDPSNCAPRASSPPI